MYTSSIFDFLELERGKDFKQMSRPFVTVVPPAVILCYSFGCERILHLDEDQPFLACLFSSSNKVG